MRAGIAFDAAELLGVMKRRAIGDRPRRMTPSAIFTGFLEWVRGSPSHLADNFAYISANTDLLGWVVERVTGKSYAALVSDLLWKPMRAEHDGYVTLDRKGAPRCTGGTGGDACAISRGSGHLVMEGGVRRRRPGRAGSLDRRYREQLKIATPGSRASGARSSPTEA